MLELFLEGNVLNPLRHSTELCSLSFDYFFGSITHFWHIIPFCIFVKITTEKVKDRVDT